MFTIRFIKHDGKGHTSYSCSSYSTNHRDGYVDVRMVMKEGDYHEQVGDEQPYGVAYVTNEAGKTIDKIAVWDPSSER